MGKKSRSKKTRESESKDGGAEAFAELAAVGAKHCRNAAHGLLVIHIPDRGSRQGMLRWRRMRHRSQQPLVHYVWPADGTLGFFAYAGIAGIAFIKGVEKHWRYAWITALLGLAFSVYLTTVSMTVLKAACPYCLTSLALMTAIFALTTYQRPAENPQL
jgi:hypothetical protein